MAQKPQVVELVSLKPIAEKSNTAKKAPYFSLDDKDRPGTNRLVWFSKLHRALPPDQVTRARGVQRHVKVWPFGLQRSSLPAINCAPRFRVT